MERYASLFLIKLFLLSGVCMLSEAAPPALRNRSAGPEENANGFERHSPNKIIRSQKLETQPAVRVVILPRSLLPKQLRWKRKMDSGKSSSKLTASNSTEDSFANSTFPSTKTNAYLIQTSAPSLMRKNSFNGTSPGGFAELRKPSATSMLSRFGKTVRAGQEGGENRNVDRFVPSKGTRFSAASAENMTNFRPIISPFTFFKKLQSKSNRSVLKTLSEWRTAGTENTVDRTEEPSATFLEQTVESAVQNNTADSPSVRPVPDPGEVRGQPEGDKDDAKNDITGALRNSSSPEKVGRQEKAISKSHAAARDEMKGEKGRVKENEKLHQPSDQTKDSEMGGEMRRQTRVSAPESAVRSDKPDEGSADRKLDVRTLQVRGQGSPGNARTPSPTPYWKIRKRGGAPVRQQEESHVIRSVQPAVGSAHDAPVSLPTSACPPGHFGPDCQQSCGRCDGGPDFCDSGTGLCRAGCDFGWIGPRCLVSCGAGTWGDRCYGCGRCSSGDAQCNRTSGHCMQGCETGWYGVRCRDECGHCLDGPGACHPLTGACLGGCKPGWQGVRCHAWCLRKTWGVNCTKVCGQCLDDVCNSTDGRCMKGCNAGWRDTSCTTPCNGNSYGPSCALTCGKCLRDKTKVVSDNGFGVCNRETGACANGCEPGYRGHGCQLPCEPGTFGHNCSQLCPPCPARGSCSCDPVTGMCTGSSCLTDGASPRICEPGRYGPSCQAQCGHCLEGRHACHPLTGSCPAGCQAGWQGFACHEPCAHLRWGPNCSRVCGYCLEDFCDGSDGRCIKGCRAGWKGIGCTAPCGNDTYGTNCAWPCGKCRKVTTDVAVNSTSSSTTTCHPETGKCAQGCEPGYTGNTCEVACRRGKYGEQCARDCPLCPDGHLCTCAPTDGQCEERGCLTKQASTVKLAYDADIASGLVIALLAVLSVALAVWVYFLQRQQKQQQQPEESSHLRPSGSTSAVPASDNDASLQDGAP